VSKFRSSSSPWSPFVLFDIAYQLHKKLLLPSLLVCLLTGATDLCVAGVVGHRRHVLIISAICNYNSPFPAIMITCPTLK
jgi:hypothetical protein